MKRDNNNFEEEGKLSIRISEKNKNIDYVIAQIFSSNPPLIPYSKKIIESILKENDVFINNVFFFFQRNSYLLTNFKLLKICFTNKKNPKVKCSSFFPICFLSTIISDKIISKKKGIIKNEKDLQLVYYSSLNIAAKFESQHYIPYPIFEKMPKSLVKRDEVAEYERKINEFLNFEYHTVDPIDILNVYQFVDKTDSIEEITKQSKLLLLFAIFDKAFAQKKKELVVLVVYYFAKMRIQRQLIWSYDLQLITGLDKRTIINNIIQLAKEIKDNFKLFCLLKAKYYNLI